MAGNNAALKIAAGALGTYAAWRLIDDQIHLSSDLRYARKLLPLKGVVKEAFANGDNIVTFWAKAVAKWASAESIIYGDKVYTYAEVDALSNKVASWASGRLQKGDTCALFMENRPEFIISWLGLAKSGIRVAMINTSIRKKGLQHCIGVSECKAVLFGAELGGQIADIVDNLPNTVSYYCVSDGGAPIKVTHSRFQIVDDEIARSSAAAPPPSATAGIGMSDIFGYIYTSGTTGLPKAAKILHSKMVTFGAFMTHGCGIQPGDRNYCVLPLFHSAGGGLGVGMMIYGGATIIIKRKFSARAFWSDCIKYRATVTQYIGELARYLLANAPSENERKHTIRLAVGNGMRPEVWDEFQDRFGIPEIGEFYGATEGNGALINHCVTKEDRGAVGRGGWLMRKLMGHKIVKFDVVEEEPVRNAAGFCVECAFDEPGELLMPIKKDDPTTAFAGYNNKKATAKKIAENVFVKGDKYFRSGDLIKQDARGYYHFVDRIGDTFRWKGENCSTTEVTECISTFLGIEECNVYGVQIPENKDGRAPMAAITPVDGDLKNIDFKALSAHVIGELPSYARPLFIRILPKVAVTATFKHQKVKLRKEGMDVTKITDPMMWLNPATKTYESFGPKEMNKVVTRQARL